MELSKWVELQSWEILWSTYFIIIYSVLYILMKDNVRYLKYVIPFELGHKLNSLKAQSDLAIAR